MNKELENRLEQSANPSKAKLLQRFFKTGKGEYGEGDIFYGITVPVQRKIASEFKELPVNELQELLDSKIHEKRMIGLLILIEQFKRADEKSKKKIFEFYLQNANKNNINNWDLVDLSCHKIVGNYILNKNREILYQLANSSNLWEKRIAIISTFSFIRINEFNDSLKIAEILLSDEHDLIHKAVGWMLREIGKKNINVLEDFLQKHHKDMPRTMLRYAIEKFDEGKRKRWLNGER